MDPLIRSRFREVTLTPADRGAIRRALEELLRYICNPETGPFARPAWIEELFSWVAEQIEPLGLRLASRFQQLNASPTFSLVRIETTGAAVWFKATGEPNRHELPVSLALSRLFPRHVPAILGVHASWNAWLSPEVPGTSLDEISECSAWERVAGELADLQIASVGNSTELLECRCKDLRLSRLARLIDPFLSRMNELMAAQEKQSPAPMTSSEVSILGDRLRDACSLLQSLSMPDTLGHIDFNPGNIVVSSERCVFLDWAEAYWGHPFLTFAYLLEHLHRNHPDVPWESRLKSFYAERWRSVSSPDDISEALLLAPLIAAFAYVVAGAGWQNQEKLRNPKFAGYLRSMTRRMHREANLVLERREPCRR